jgi:hypothetical protein
MVTTRIQMLFAFRKLATEDQILLKQVRSVSHIIIPQPKVRCSGVAILSKVNQIIRFYELKLWILGRSKYAFRRDFQVIDAIKENKCRSIDHKFKFSGMTFKTTSTN